MNALPLQGSLPRRVAFVALRPPRTATGETATIAYHHRVLEDRMGIQVVFLSTVADGDFAVSRFSSARLDHLNDVRPRLRADASLPVVWFVPSPGQIPIVAWAMRGLPNPTAVVVEGAPLLPEGDWSSALRRMPRFMAIRAALNGEPVARLARLSRPLVVATASAYHLRRLRRTLPDWQAVWLPNGSPGLPLESRWRPPETPNPRIIGHTLFNKGGDIAFAASALAARTRPGLTVDWARPDAGRIPPAFVPDGLPIRAHQLVDPYGFVAGASVVLAPLRLSCGTNVYPNVLIEAMASGVPLLTSDLRTHRELVGHEAADALVPDFRPETWANRLGTLLDDPVRARNLGERLLARARMLWGGDEPVQRWVALLSAMHGTSVETGTGATVGRR